MLQLYKRIKPLLLLTHYILLMRLKACSVSLDGVKIQNQLFTACSRMTTSDTKCAFFDLF